MTRVLPQEIIDSSLEPIVRPFIAVDLLFDSPNELRFWSGYGDLTIGGVTYTGAGDLLQISDVRESSDVAANGATLTLSGIPSDLISLAIDEPYQGRVCKIKLGMIDYYLAQGQRLLVEPGSLLNVNGGHLLIASRIPANFFDLFIGYMDQMNIADGPETATITLSVENKMIDLERARIRRYTDEGQQSRYSGDLAFEFVTRLQGEDLSWGT